MLNITDKDLKPSTWRDRLSNRIGWWLYLRFRIRTGPFMFRGLYGGVWFLVDSRGWLYRLTYTPQWGGGGVSLLITLVNKGE